MADYISKVQLEGKQYLIKDAEAHDLIAALGEPMHFVGVTTTSLSDGSTTTPTISGNSSYAPKKGDVVINGSREYVWDGSAWREFGDLSDLGELGDFAHADTGTATFTPDGDVTVTLGNITGSVTTTVGKPSGTISKADFTGTEDTLTDEAEVTGTVTSSFVGQNVKSTGTFTPAGTIDAITPEGSVAITPVSSQFVTNVTAPTVESSFSGTATQIEASTTANTFTASVKDEILTLTAAAATVTGTVTANGTVTSNVTPGEVSKSDAVTSATAKFTGTKVTPTFKGTDGSVEVNGTSAGTVTSSLTNATADVSITYQPAGTISALTFTGNDLTASSQLSINQPTASATFSGKEQTITVNPED